jgi:restriction system protein
LAISPKTSFELRLLRTTVPKRSLFAILTELPWWFSLLVAALIYMAGALFNPLIGAAAALPFLGVTGYVAWLRLKRGPTADFPAMIKALRGASPEEMRAMLAEAFTRQRYEVSDGRDGDLELQRNGYVTLVRFRRWRAQSTQPGAIAELAQAMRARRADHAIYITAGSVSDGSRQAAQSAGIALLDGMALANLVVRTRAARKAVSRSAAAAAKA